MNPHHIQRPGRHLSYIERQVRGACFSLYVYVMNLLLQAQAFLQDKNECLSWMGPCAPAAVTCDAQHPPPRPPPLAHTRHPIQGLPTQPALLQQHPHHLLREGAYVFQENGCGPVPTRGGTFTQSFADLLSFSDAFNSSHFREPSVFIFLRPHLDVSGGHGGHEWREAGGRGQQRSRRGPPMGSPVGLMSQQQSCHVGMPTRTRDRQRRPTLDTP